MHAQIDLSVKIVLGVNVKMFCVHVKMFVCSSKFVRHFHAIVT